jgi:hypothetical protein
MYEHNRHGRRVRARIVEIRAAGYKVIYEKWFESEDENFCYWMEIFLIDYFDRKNLCNLTRGGATVPSGMDHPMKDPKVAAKVSATLKGRLKPRGKDSPLFGKPGNSRGSRNFWFGKPGPLRGVKGPAHPRYGLPVKRSFVGKGKDNPMYGKGERIAGEKNGNSSLDEWRVRKIFEYRHDRKWTQVRLAKLFKVSQVAISLILRGKKWGHLGLREKYEVRRLS